MVIARLKRSRNSLLNVSKLPPEILGNIFGWNVTLKGDFDGLEEESHNFLLVCHNWFEVASSTPELWSFWGNTPKDWARWHRRSGTAPLDLVLDVEEDDGSFGATLCGVLQDRAIRDTIRRIHLKARGSKLLSSIISPLTADPEEFRSTSVESLILHDKSGGPVDVSDFLAHYNFPKLQHLKLFNCTFSSWDLITSRTPVLTTLDLYRCDQWPSPSPTTSRLLTMLASYPTLQSVSLSWYGDPGGGGGHTSPRVSLHQLKELKLGGTPQGVFGLLDRLDHPRHVNSLDINLNSCEARDISQVIGPYLRGYLQHRDGFRNGLGLSLSLPYSDSIALHIGDAGGIDFSAPVPARMNTFAAITIEFNRQPPEDQIEKAILDLIAHAPREDIVYFRVYGDPVAMGDISAQLPYLRGLHLEKMPLTSAFPNSNLNTDIFPSLEYIFLDWVVADRGNWSPLTTFLDFRVSSGNRLRTLLVKGSHLMSRSLWQSLGDVVQVLARVARKE